MVSLAYSSLACSGTYREEYLLHALSVQMDGSKVCEEGNEASHGKEEDSLRAAIQKTQ